MVQTVKKDNNKKVKNATLISYDNIKFKSKLEASCYKKLEASGLKFKYEPERIPLWVGENINNTIVYEVDKRDRKLLSEKKDNFKLRDITYTPDFKIEHKNYIAYVDAKGFVNDVYPIKKKMFIQYLNNIKDNKKYIFFEPRSVKHMLQIINIIKTL